MSRAVRLLATVALVAAALPAAAYLRETTEPGIPAGGTCLWWGNPAGSRQVPVQVNAKGLEQTACTSLVDAELAVTTALARWGNATRSGGQSPCTDFAFEPVTATSQSVVGADYVNRIVFRTGVCAAGQDPNVANCWIHANDATIALTTTSFDAVTGRIFDADVEVHAWNGANGSYLSCGDGTTACVAPTGTCIDIQSVLTHEAGHMLGLDHVCTAEFGPGFYQCPSTGPQPIMSPKTGTVSDRALQPDDIEGVCSIYPMGAATLTCAPVQPKKANSGGGCDSAGGAGILGLAGLLATWRRRGRRRG